MCTFKFLILNASFCSIKKFCRLNKNLFCIDWLKEKEKTSLIADERSANTVEDVDDGDDDESLRRLELPDDVDELRLSPGPEDELQFDEDLDELPNDELPDVAELSGICGLDDSTADDDGDGEALRKQMDDLTVVDRLDVSILPDCQLDSDNCHKP